MSTKKFGRQLVVVGKHKCPERKRGRHLYVTLPTFATFYYWIYPFVMVVVVVSKNNKN